RMKTKSLFLLTLTSLAMMLPEARAVDQIYSGAATFTRLGDGDSTKTRGGVYIIVNLGGSSYKEVRFFTVKGVKFFDATDDPDFLTTFYVDGPKDQTFKEIVVADTPQKATEVVSTLFELTGKATLQQYQTGGTMLIPKTMGGFLKRVHLPFNSGP